MYPIKKPLLILFIICFSVACEKPMPFDGVKYILNSNIIKTSFAFQFINAKTKEPIGIKNGQKVNVTVLGPDKDAVLNITGFSKNPLKSDRGFLSLGLNTSFTPTPSRKLNVTLVFEANGYVSSDFKLNVSSTGNYIHIIPLVEIAKTPDGVTSVVTSSSALQSGQTTADILIQSPLIVYSNTKASVKIDKGTLIKDIKGSILSAPLKMTLVYFNNMEEGALSAHPGGLISRVDSGGKIYEGSFSTAGYIVCKIKDKNGKIAYSFSKPITYTLEVNAVSINPLTGSFIQAGEKIGVWSYNNATAIWKYEKSTNFSGPASNGNFVLITKVNKLLPYNWDWFDGNCICNKGVDLTFNYPSVNGNFGVQIKAYSEASSQLISTYNFVVKNGETVNMHSTSMCKGVYLHAYNDCGQLLGIIQMTDLCEGSYSFDLASPLGDKSVSVNLKALCGSDSSKVVLRPNSPVWYQPPCGTSWKAAGILDNGKITFSNLEANKSYSFGTFFDNRWVTFPFTTESSKQIDKQMILSSELCLLLDR